MGVRGPAPLPQAILQMRGSKYAKDRTGMPEATGKPVKPRGLKGDAAWLWKFIVTELSENGTVARLDTPMLIVACDLWAKYRAASKVADEKPGDKDARIAVSSYFAAFDRAVMKLGLSPADRQRLRVGESVKKRSGVPARKRETY